MKPTKKNRQRTSKFIACLLSLLLAFAMTPAAAFAAEGGDIAAGSTSSDMFSDNPSANDSETAGGAAGNAAGDAAGNTAGDADSPDADKASEQEDASGQSATTPPIPGVSGKGIPYDYQVGATEKSEWTDIENPVTANEPKYATDSLATQEDSTTFTYGNWKYMLINGGAAVLGYTGSTSTLVIPKTINGTKVISVLFDPDTSSSDRNSVWGNASTIKLNENIVTIGGNAFYSCTSLTHVDMSSAPLTYIGTYAFVNTGITSLTLPDTLVNPDMDAFNGMYNLEDFFFNVNLKAFTQTTPVIAGSQSWNVTQYLNPAPRSPNVTYHVPGNSANYMVQDGVLYSKDGSVLYSRPIGMEGSHFSVPSNVRHIADYAFFGTSKLQTVTLNNGLQSIGSSAFALSSLTRVTIPGTVQSIANYAFSRSKSLTSVYFEDGLTDLWNGGASEQFYECTALQYVRLPETLTRVGNAAFAGTALTSLDIPASVTDINYGAFGDIRTLSSVTGGEGLKNIRRLSFRNAAISSFPFGDNLECVSGDAFYGCTHYANPAYPSYLELSESGDYVSNITKVYVSGIENYDFAYQVLTIVNTERAKAGLSALTMDADLQKAAMQRAAELLVSFSHTRPSGASCFTACSKMSGENIAAGQANPAAVMNSWMNSAGHKGNILESSFSSIGVGCYVQNGRCVWVQAFGRSTATAASKPANSTVEHEVTINPDSQQILIGITGNVNYPIPGKTVQLTAYSNDTSPVRGLILPKSFDWESSNVGVATVDQSGRATAKAVGTSTIKACVKGAKLAGTYKLTVYSNSSGTSSGTSTGSNSSSSGSSQSGSSNSAKATSKVAMYRLYNHWSGEHFYTGNLTERNDLVKVGWTYEGVGWYAPKSGGSNVYRLYNRWSGDHHFTTSASEKNACVKAGWTYEGVGWKSGGSKPIFREYNPYASCFYHNYTANSSEHSKLCSIGWKSEGVGWYGV